MHDNRNNQNRLEIFTDTIHPHKMTSSTNFNEFMRAHRVGSDLQAPVITHTRIGKSSNNPDEVIYGGKYHIPDDKRSTFMKLYYDHVFVKGNEEYLTEKQMETGPIAVDLDLRFAPSVKKRVHGQDHIMSLITIYLGELEKMYKFDENPFYIYVMEKPDINPVKNADTGLVEFVKDGIHIIIGVNADRNTQLMLREAVIEKIKQDELWAKVPITNDWDKVFDLSISAGHANWQLYGSCKPGHKAYRLTGVHKNIFDPADGELSTSQMSMSEYFNMRDKIDEISVRSDKGQKYFMTSEFLRKYQENSGIASASSGAAKKSVSTTLALHAAPIPYSGFIPVDAILNIKNRDDLNAILMQTLAQLENRDYELLETYKYTMTLPESYYGDGSYDKWIRVGWALSNTCPSMMFIVWVAFSAQSKKFSFRDISDMYDRWQRFDSKSDACLTRRSIMHWSKQDAPAKYKDVQDNSVDYFIEKSIDGNDFDLGDSKSMRKDTSDHDIACALKQLYSDQYVCVNIKQNIWYRFMNHRWIENDSGTTLRKSMSDDLRKIYRRKSKDLDATIDQIMDQDEADPRIKRLKKRQGRICEIINRLGDAGDKDHIMKEAKELFWDQSLIEKLDTNPYLLCFNNGVIDFKEKVFRRGYPEDYVSKTTNIDYIELNDKRDAKIIGEINEFMAKLFPREELRRYMWEHLASVLLGTHDKQTFHMYIGEGRNGKSVLTTLLDEILGEYKGIVPLSAITQDRQKIGGTSAELVMLKGVRYAVIMEPSKKDVILEGPLKQLTSGLDPIQCRALYIAKPIEFYPQFKLVCCSNVRMEIKTQDFGTWRRVREVPFEALFTENPVNDDPEKPFQYLVDPSIVDKFPEWKYVFMAMLAKIAFKTGGAVSECSIVTAASKAYQESQDFIAEFIRDKIATIAGGKIKKQELNSEFTIWYMNTYGKGAPNPKEVHAYMDKKFGKFEKNGAWLGARIKYERDEPNVNAAAFSATNSESGSVRGDGDGEDENFDDNIEM